MNNRLARLREILNEKRMDAAIIVGRPNTLYLSGFTGSASFLLVGMDKAWLIVDFRYTLQARQQALEGIEVIEQTESFHSTLNELMRANKLKSIGFEGNTLTVSEYERLTQKLTYGKSFVNLGGVIDQLRQIKDAHEIESIQKAVLLGDKVFDHILKFIKPGLKETEISAEMEYIMRKLGAKGPSFETIVASGHRSAMCHGTASDNTLKQGDALVLDFGVIYQNYCSDMTRTLFIGEPKNELVRIYNIVKKAQEAVLNSLVMGMSGFEADKIARDIITEEGYGKAFGHSLGHGVGIEIHEDPRLSTKSEDILQEGMVFTVEPGIYVEGLGGVRIEDMVVFVDGKLRNFTTSTKNMIIL